MYEGLRVHNEIGRLRRVMLHRPGEELLSLIPADLGRLLFDDIPFLEEARREHDAFAQTLRDEGVEVVYLEQLAAEALDAVPGAREEFMAEWLEESGVVGEGARAVVSEYMEAIEDTREFVDKSIAGIRWAEIDVPAGSGDALAELIGTTADAEGDLLVDPMPNAYFTRDPFAVVGRGVCLNRMYSVTRSRETLLGSYIFRYHPLYRDAPLWYRRDSAFHTEGGDVTNLSASTLAVGISQRTQAAAIDELAYNVLWANDESEVEQIYAIKIPSTRAFMHLDTVFTQVDVDKFTYHPGIMGTMQVFRIARGARLGELAIVEVSDSLDRVLAGALGLDAVELLPCGAGDPVAAAREQWNDGSNTLCVAPGRICVYDRNAVSNEFLAAHGLTLLEIPSAELSRGRGGPRCMSMPFWRDEL